MFALFLITIVASFLTGLLAPTQKAKRGNLKDFTFPQIGDGDPIAYLAGTVKITGPGLTWYGDYSTKAIKKSTGLFSKTTVGYKYYLGWMLVFCIGPNVTLRRLWFGTKSGDDEADAQENNPNFTNPNDPKVPTPIYSGSFGTGTMHLADSEAFGGDEGGGGYDLQIEFFGGENNQAASPYLRSKINGFVPPYRGVCYLTCHGYIGNSTQLQNMTAELQRIPDPLALGSKALIGSEGDVNPANVLYDMMTNNFGAGSCPVSRMDSQSFLSAGAKLFDEDEGISIASGGSAQAMSSVIQDILRQIDATMYEDPETGLITIKLLREDYVIGDLLVIDDANIISVSNYAINLWSDTKNRVRLKYEDRTKDYDDRIAVGEDMANVSFQGGQVKAIAVEHPYIKRKDHANRKTASELAVYSTPLARMSTTVQRISTTLRPGSVIKASYGKYRINQLILRVTKISYGDLVNNHLTLELTGDKFAKTTSIFSAPVTYFSKPSTGAISILSYTFDETPRFFNLLQSSVVNVEAPRVMVYPFAPNEKQTGYNLWTKAAGEADFVETLDNADFADFFQTLNALSQTNEADIELQAVTSADALLTSTLDQIKHQGYGLLQIDDEIIAYESFSLDNGTKRYTLHGVRRGLLDTVPAAHAARSLLTVLSPSVVGQREFAATDTVDVRMGSVAATGPQDVDQATGAILVLQNRPMRPYPPVLVMLDGAAFPATVDNSAGVAVTWKRRNRLNDTILFEDAADEAPEAGTEYFVRFGAGDSFQDVSLGTGTAGTFTFALQGDNQVEFYSKLGDLESYQRIKFRVNVLHAAGVNASASLSTSTVTGYLTTSVTITFGVSLQTAYASPLSATAVVPVSVTTGVNLSTATTSNLTAHATISGGGPVVETHRYWGIRVLNTEQVPDGNGPGFSLAELEMFTDLAGTNLALTATAFEPVPAPNYHGSQVPSHLNNGLKDGGQDGNYAPYSDGSLFPFIVAYDFASPVAINYVRMFGCEDPYTIGNPKDFDVVASDDGTTWTTKWSVVGQTAWGNLEPRVFTPPALTPTYTGSPWGAHTYWRVLLDGEENNYYGYGMAEMEFAGSLYGVAQTNIVAEFARDTFGGAGISIANLHDGNPNTSWGSNSDLSFRFDVGYQFSAPVHVAEVRLRARPAADDAQIYRQMPKEIEIQFSDDGLAWSTAWTVPTIPTWSNGELRGFVDPSFIGSAIEAPVAGPAVTPSFANGSGDRRSYVYLDGTLPQSGEINNYLNGNTTENSTYFAGASSGYLDFNFYEPTIVTGFRLLDDTSGIQGQYVWQGSNDGSTFTTISDQFTLQGNTPDTSLSANTASYRIYRLLLVGGNTTNGPYVREMEFQIGYDLAVFAIHHPQGRGNRAADITVTIGGVGYSGDPNEIISGSRPIGRNNGPYWNSGSPTGYVDFTFAEERFIDRALWLMSGGDLGNSATFKWQGVHGDGTATDLCAAKAVTGIATEFLLDHSVPYKTFRLIIASGTTSNGPYWNDVLFSINQPYVFTPLGSGSYSALDDGNGNALEG